MFLPLSIDQRRVLTLIINNQIIYLFHGETKAKLASFVLAKLQNENSDYSIEEIESIILKALSFQLTYCHLELKSRIYVGEIIKIIEKELKLELELTKKTKLSFFQKIVLKYFFK